MFMLVFRIPPLYTNILLLFYGGHLSFVYKGVEKVTHANVGNDEGFPVSF